MWYWQLGELGQGLHFILIWTMLFLDFGTKGRFILTCNNCNRIINGPIYWKPAPVWGCTICLSLRAEVICWRPGEAMTVKMEGKDGGMTTRWSYRLRKEEEMTGWGMRAHRGDWETLGDIKWVCVRDILENWIREVKNKKSLGIEWRKQMKKTNTRLKETEN